MFKTLAVRTFVGITIFVDGDDMEEMLNTFSYLHSLWSHGINQIDDNRATRAALPTRMQRR